jgi:hypothetical protein
VSSRNTRQRRRIDTLQSPRISPTSLRFRTGFKAFGAVRPEAANKIAKVNKLPSSLYSKAKRALHDVWVAETRSSAETTSNGPAMKIASRGFEQAAVVLAHQRYVVALCRGAMLWRYVVALCCG